MAPITGTEHDRIAQRQFARAFDTDAFDAPDDVTEFYKTITLSATRPFLEHYQRTGMEPAEEYLDTKTPEATKSVDGPPKTVTPVLIGRRAEITFRTWELRNFYKLRNIAMDLRRAGRLGSSYRLVDPLLVGNVSSTATNRHRDIYGDPIFGANHKMAGGYLFNNIYTNSSGVTNVNLELTYDNYRAMVRYGRMNHRDGRGNPGSYFRGQIGLVTGEALADRVEQIFGSDKEPFTDANTTNVAKRRYKNMAFMCSWIDDERWCVFDMEMKNRGLLFVLAMMQDFRLMPVYIDPQNDMRHMRLRGWMQNTILDAPGIMFSAGPSS